MALANITNNVLTDSGTTVESLVLASRTLTINGVTYDLTANRDWTLSTSNVGEGTNLYYTTARANTDFDTRLATKSTTNLSEGTNLYYTDARVGTYLTNNSYATQTYVNTAVSNLVDAAPGTLDTLNELAAALGDDPNFATTVATSIGTKEPTITAGTTSQYWRGDKTWQTLPIYTLSGLGGQPQLNGTGFVKVSGTTVSYDNSTYYLASNPSGYITGNQNITLSGEVTGSGATSIVTTIANNAVTTAKINNGAVTAAKLATFGAGEGLSWAANTDGASIKFESTGDGGSGGRALSNLVIALIDNADEGLIVTSDNVELFFVNTNQIQYKGNNVWHAGNLTNLNQLTNGPGYLTSESDTLATVTGRGAATSTAVTFNGGFNDGYITFSLAQINRSGGNVELQFASGGGVRMFGAGATPISFTTSGGATFSGSISASNLSGTNTGDQTTITGNAGSANYALKLDGYANQTIYTILDGPANGPVWKVRYDSATANRYVDLGFKDGNGVYYEGFKIYNNDTPTWAGSTIWHQGNLTNLSQLTNGPGYITSSSLTPYVPIAGGVNMTGKLGIMNATNGAGDRGIAMWQVSDTNWGIYMTQAGAGLSFSNGTASSSIDGRTSHHIRFRTNNSSTNGFIWENASESALMSLTADTGNLYTRGQIYAGNSTSNLVWHAGNFTPGNYLPLSGGTLTGTLTATTINATGLATSGALYFAGIYGNTYNTDTMYMEGRNVASNIQALDLYIGDDGRNTVLPQITGGQDGSVDAFCIRATNDGIHHIFDSAGDSWHGRHLYTPNGNMYMGGNIVATQSWVSSQSYITGYTETDTLASVTGRGASTSSSITINNSTFIQPDALSNVVGLFIRNNNTGGYGSSLGLGLYGYNSPAAYFNPLRIESSYPGYGVVNFYVKGQSNSSEISAINILGSSGAVTLASSLTLGGTLYLPGSISGRTAQIEFNNSASVNLLGMPNQTTTFYLQYEANGIKFTNDNDGDIFNIRRTSLILRKNTDIYGQLYNLNKQAIFGDNGGSQKYLRSIDLDGQDYRHRYIVICRMPTFGNVTVNCGWSGSTRWERVNGIGIQLHDEFDLTVSYANQIYFNQTSYQEFQTQLVQIPIDGVQYLALYSYSAPGWAVAYFDVVRKDFGGWMDSNEWSFLHYSTAQHTSVSYISTNTRIKQPLNVSGGVTASGKGVFGTVTSTEIGNAGSNPVEAGVNYGIFHHSGVGLGIASGAGGGTQGITFWNNNGSSFFRSMIITGSDGRVGIGVTNPISQLDVYSSRATSSAPTIFLNHNGAYGQITALDSYHGLILRGYPTVAGDYTVQPGDVMSFFEYGGDFRFYQKNASNVLTMQGRLNNGTWTVTGDVVAYGSPSDISFKTNIKPLEKSLDKIVKLKGVSFDWKSDTEVYTMTGIKEDIGFIAQEVETILPNLVRKNNNGLLSLRDKGITALLVEAVKEQQGQIESQKSEIEELKDLVKQLINR
jgi:hypothetical protein